MPISRCKVIGTEIDFRADRTYILIQPSVTAGPYQWVAGLGIHEIQTYTLPVPVAQRILDALDRAKGGRGKLVKPPPTAAIASPEIAEKARAWANFQKTAVQGAHGSDTTLWMFCELLRKWPGLTDAQLIVASNDWNAACQPPWSLPELQHKIADARIKAFENETWIHVRNQKFSPMIDDCIEALAPLEIYQRAFQLVEVRKAPETKSDDVVRRSQGASIVTTIENERLVELLDQAAVFYHEAQGERKRTVAPRWIAKTIQCRPEWPGIRPLDGFVDWPVLRPDGSILSKPGFDETTRLICRPDTIVPNFTEPTQADAAKAREILETIVCDFPFAGPEHKSVWLASVLTAFARPAIDGPVPLTIFEASERGSGKTMLSDIIGWITTGRDLPRASDTKDQEECRKAMMSVALSADPIVLIDNVKGLFRNETLERVLTGTSIQDRILGKNEMRTVPIRTQFLLTANNCEIEADMRSRSLLCRITPDCEDPTQRTKFKFPDLRSHVIANRKLYVTAALVILRGYFAAGRPPVQHLPTRYLHWSNIVQSSVIWAGGMDPFASNRDLADRIAPEDASLAEILTAWHKEIGERRIQTRDIFSLCVEVDPILRTISRVA